MAWCGVAWGGPACDDAWRHAQPLEPAERRSRRCWTGGRRTSHLKSPTRPVHTPLRYRVVDGGGMVRHAPDSLERVPQTPPQLQGSGVRVTPPDRAQRSEAERRDSLERGLLHMSGGGRAPRAVLYTLGCGPSGGGQKFLLGTNQHLTFGTKRWTTLLRRFCRPSPRQRRALRMRIATRCYR